MQTGLAAHTASLVACHCSLHEVQHVIAIHGLLQHSHDFQHYGLRRDGRQRAGHQHYRHRYFGQFQVLRELEARNGGHLMIE